MFKVSLPNGDSYHVLFQYEAPGEKKFGKRKAKTHSTMCRILQKVGDLDASMGQAWIAVSYGIAKQYQGGYQDVLDSTTDRIVSVYAPPDCYKKSEGRKLAFERALEGMVLHRDARSAFWKGYASMLPKNGNGETKWK